MSTPYEQLEALRKSVNEQFEQFGAGLSSLNDHAPSSTQAATQAMFQKAGDVDNDAVSSFRTWREKALIEEAEASALRETLKTKSLAELHLLFAKQAANRSSGVPLDAWLMAGGNSVQQGMFDGRHGLISQIENPQIQKALDSTQAGALIRQDLEPILYALFVKQFPVFDRIAREPANGLVHAYDQMLSYGDADFIGELDSVTDDRGVYARQITNIAILATRRGVSLKSQFAVLAGGAGFNPERLELQAGMTAMRSRFQKTILHGNWTDATGTINNEKGPYDADSFDGLRKILNTASAINVDPGTNPTTTGSIRRAIDAATLAITEAGGSPTAVWGAPQDKTTWNEQLDERVMLLQDNLRNAQDGALVSSVNTEAGMLPFFSIPGGAMAPYVPSTLPSGWAHARDIYIPDESALSVPYLGPSGPSVIEVPIGVTGQLTHLFILFFMGGLAVKAPTWMNKVRVKVD